ncbi:hypothetical protein [Pontibacter vulgaris]|uniref:hypothetical protein n=1 Tax=Pontibacter vulgaris TaxID=2905679 RepID=UPI001FA792F7|nr:hypothetical protein [Pontibacter vulgaris]
MKSEKQDKGQQKKSDLTDTSKRDKSDISNSLARDAKGDKGVNNYTPQNRTDNEQKEQKKKGNL